MCNIVLPVQHQVSREDARKMLKRSIHETQILNNSLREGTWKAITRVDIVAPNSNSKTE